MKNITIIGAGNGGMTAAYHFAKLGHSICLYDSPDFDTQIKAVQSSGQIEAVDSLHDCNMMFAGTAKIDKATTDIKEAVSYSDLLVMVCPSFAQEILFEKMLPHLKTDQTLILMPGNYGGLVLNNMKKNKGYDDLSITFVDSISIPWACRIVSPGKIAIMGIKEFLPMSIFPKTQSSAVKEKIESCFPIPVEILDHPIIAGLENINFGGHPLLTTLNIGLLENFEGNFNYYKDCCSPATANAAAKMDCERLSVGNALDINLRTELEAMNALYDSNAQSVYEFNRASTTHAKIQSAPASSKSRYITEDVAYLLVPCYELATLAGIRVPIVESCIHIASAYNDTDYFKTGRTLEKMGLGNTSLSDLKDSIR